MVGAAFSPASLGHRFSLGHQLLVGGVSALMKHPPLLLLGLKLLGMTLLLSACSLLPGASQSPRDAALQALADHQAQWASKQIDDYTFTLTAQCFCPLNEPIDITVANGVVTSVTKAGEPVAPNEVQGLPKTAIELFVVVAAQAKAASLTVEWDPEFGFPSNIQVDSIANAIDDEFGYTVTNFRPAS
ncbi:MAG: DUF6174 domain-containing protein [Candidatus Limnocylindrales bacterium]